MIDKLFLFVVVCHSGPGGFLIQESLGRLGGGETRRKLSFPGRDPTQRGPVRNRGSDQTNHLSASRYFTKEKPNFKAHPPTAPPH